MSSFKFALQQVLDFRFEAMRNLEIKIEDIYQKKLQLKTLLNIERDCYFEDRSQLNAALKACELHKIPLLEYSLELRKNRMLQILEYLKEIEADLDILERALIQSKKDLKAIENLKAKREADFYKTLELNEKKFMDEQANLRFLRREHADDHGDKA